MSRYDTRTSGLRVLYDKEAATINGTQKIGQSLDTLTLPFLQNFNGLLFGWTL